MNDTLKIALIVAISTTLAPMLLAYLNGRQRRQERKEQWDRDDEIDRRNRLYQEAIKDSVKASNQKLDTIKHLVDGNLTAAMQSELDATQRTLSICLELKRQALAHGEDVDPALNEQIKLAEVKISELSQKLAIRLEAIKSAE